MTDEVVIKEARELSERITDAVANNDAEVIAIALCEVLSKVICIMADRLEVSRERVGGAVINHLIENVQVIVRKQ